MSVRMTGRQYWTGLRGGRFRSLHANSLQSSSILEKLAERARSSMLQSLVVRTQAPAKGLQGKFCLKVLFDPNNSWGGGEQEKSPHLFFIFSSNLIM